MVLGWGKANVLSTQGSSYPPKAVRLVSVVQGRFTLTPMS